MICEYGCGQQANYQLRNDKWCCSPKYNSCLNSKKKNSLSLKGKMSGKNNPNYGNKYSEETKSILSEKKKGKNHPSWKGGYTSNNIPLYDTYSHQIKYAEQVRRNKEDKNILEVKCTYCGKWFIPKRTEIKSRIFSLSGKRSGEARLYCSNECKQECPIYRKIKFSAEETDTKQLSREVQPELRQMVFERDNWECQKCSNKKNLHCHHVEGIRWEPLESADIDKCITYCKKCHKEVHNKEGCGYKDMKCKEK